MRLDVELLAIESFAPRVWELRNNVNNVTSYDAWYVAQGCELFAGMVCGLFLQSRPMPSYRSTPSCDCRRSED